MFVRRCDLAKVSDINGIGSEECVQQHKLLICKIDLQESVKKRKEKFVGRHKVWRLRETEIRKDFAERVQYREERREEGDLESMWKGLKDCLLEETEAVCGKTKGRARHKTTWWWNKDTELAVKDKRRAYELWKKSGLEVDKVAYRLAKGRSKRVVDKDKDEERQRYCDMLEEEDGKGTVFRIAKQMVELNKDICASGCVKGVDGRTVVEEEGIMQRWKEYYEQLLNEEFDWNKDNTGSFDVMNREEASVDERLISVYEVRLAIGKAKSGKAAGPSGVAADMLKAAGEAGVRWVTDICNEVVRSGVVPADWRRSWMVYVYKGKGNALECSSYRGIKLLDHVLKVLERVLEARLRKTVKLDHHHHHHHFVYRLSLIIVHTKARVRRYQQLNPSNMSYLVHLSSLVRAFSCLYSHTASMSSYFPPFFTPPPTSKCLHLETQSSTSLRSTCPNHLSMPRLTTLSTLSIPNPRLSSSLFLQSFRVTPDIHLTILFSVLTSLRISTAFIGQVSLT